MSSSSASATANSVKAPVGVLAVLVLVLIGRSFLPPNTHVLPSHSSYPYRVFGPSTDYNVETTRGDISFEYYTYNQQRDFLIQYGQFCQPSTTNVLLQRFDELPEHLAVELWKYCVLYTGIGNVFWQADNAKPWMEWEEWLLSDDDVTKEDGSSAPPNKAIRIDPSIHGFISQKTESDRLQIASSFLFLQESQSHLASDMMRLLVQQQAMDPVQLAETLGLYISMSSDQQWKLWTAQCLFREVSTPSNVLVSDQTNRQRHCPAAHGGYCCQVWQPGVDWPFMALQRPYVAVPQPPVPLPYSLAQDEKTLDDVNETYLAMVKEDVPYIATVRSTPTNLAPVSQHETPNFFDILAENSCLPGTRECFRCLKLGFHGEPEGGSCEKCAGVCDCFCAALCKIRPPPKRLAAEWTVQRPFQRKDASRHIPREVHQTWYEPITKEKYPNMSRLIESFRQSGWTYHFYDDDSAGQFLSAHFPPQVRQAYDAITPGAFKADLFRYCVLLIRGGLYVDMDILLESHLDHMIPPEVGFMTPQDEPGEPLGARSCLWNGFLAAAPGHPFLARTIQNVVNNIQNRFTSVDYDDMLCPDPVLAVAHSVDVLFTCGPCVLGSSINEVLGKHPQASFVHGDIDLYQVERSRDESTPSEHRKLQVDHEDSRLLIPGRSILLRQNKADMGAHRFTWDEHNTVVATTDLPDYDDRPKTIGHYSDTHEQFGIYGLHKLYVDNKRSNEVVSITVQP